MSRRVSLLQGDKVPKREREVGDNSESRIADLRDRGDAPGKMPPPLLVSYSGESDANTRTPAATVPERAQRGLTGSLKKGLRRKKWGVYSGGDSPCDIQPAVLWKKTHDTPLRRRFTLGAKSVLAREKETGLAEENLNHRRSRYAAPRSDGGTLPLSGISESGISDRSRADSDFRSDRDTDRDSRTDSDSGEQLYRILLRCRRSRL